MIFSHADDILYRSFAVWHYINVIFQLSVLTDLLLGAFLGGLVGLERDFAGKVAGARTYALVALGSTLFTIIGRELVIQLGEGAGADPTRIPAQIVTGIGFIGAGIIIHQGLRARGITTAAGLWVVAAIGTAVGFKMYPAAIFTSFLGIIILYFLRKIDLEKEFHEVRE
ncbi:MAG: MgtC/SapB family protein [Candidatus Portnoybacteria bacterium]|nr:MgtC/SapB family protein [Candidatus Portnoybacteria bacterium]